MLNYSLGYNSHGSGSFSNFIPSADQLILLQDGIRSLEKNNIWVAGYDNRHYVFELGNITATDCADKNIPDFLKNVIALRRLGGIESDIMEIITRGTSGNGDYVLVYEEERYGDCHRYVPGPLIILET